MTTSAEGPRVAGAVARLRAAGERVTPARYAVLRVVDAADAADEHLTAEQIGGRVAQVEPSVHRATVYRTLTSLSEIGVLSHVHLGGSATVYHLAAEPDEGVAAVSGSASRSAPGSAPGSAPAPALVSAHTSAPGHAHVQCHHCGKVFDVPPDAFDTVAARLSGSLGFTLDTSHAALLGTCRDCASQG